MKEDPKEGCQALALNEEPETNPDARVLDVDYDSSRERYKEWRQVSLEVKEYQSPDWPLDGPLTTHPFGETFSKVR